MTKERAQVLNGMSQVKGAAVAVVALIIGLVIGLFIPFGQVAPADTVTVTDRETILMTIIETQSGPSQGAKTETVTQTMISTMVPTESEKTTVIQTVTEVATATMTSEMSTTKQTEAGKILVTYSGSGEGKSAPFTATTSTVKVTVRLPSEGYLMWYIFEVGEEWFADMPSASGSVNDQKGTFESYGYNFEVGRKYYLDVKFASAEYEIIVEEA